MKLSSQNLTRISKQMELYTNCKIWGQKGRGDFGCIKVGHCPSELVHQTYLSLSHEDRNCGRCRGRKVCARDTHTQRQTYSQVILYLSNAMNCIGQTIIQLTNLSLFNIICHLMASFHSGSSINSTQTKCVLKPRLTRD